MQRFPILVAVGLLAACSNAVTPVTESNTAGIQAAHRGHGSATHKELTAADLRAIAQVRQATAKFQDIEVAKAAGYNVQFPAGCASSPQGGQGFHWINNGLVNDEIDLLEPELVMYEPQPGGSMKLVGVDYVVPYEAGSAAPKLLGRDFTHLEALGVWAIHIWAWSPNENGMFAPWNPSVSCANAG